MAETKGNILKVRLGNDTRRQVLYNTNTSYNDLVLMLQRVFEGKLQPTDDVTLKYFDEDDDLITIADDSDFAHARDYSQTGVVKMVIYINGRDVRTNMEGSSVGGLRKELGEVRNKVNAIIDCLDAQAGSLNLDSTIGETGSAEMVAERVESTSKPVSTEAVSIFDPFKPSSSPVITTTSALHVTETTSTITTHPTVTTSNNTTGSSSSSTSHLFQGQSDAQFLDQSQTQASNLAHSNSQIPTQQTGQTGVPQTGQQQLSQSNPTAPPISSSPKPPQQSGYSGYPSGQGTNTYQGGSSFATGQANFPTSQSGGYQSGQTGYQTGQTTGYNAGLTYVSSYPPPQSSAPMPPPSSSSTQYPPSSTIPAANPYPPSSYSPGPPYNPNAATGYNQPQVGYTVPPQSGPPFNGAGRGSNRVTAYGQAHYKIGY